MDDDVTERWSSLEARKPMSGLPVAMDRATPPPTHTTWRLSAVAFIAGIVLGILQPLFVVAVGGFGIVAGPSYVGLVFLLILAGGLVDAIVVLFAWRLRRTTVPILALCASLALGMVGGNVLASTLHISFAGPGAQPTVPEPTGAAWSRAGSMLTARQQHAATLLRDGHVLVAGGMGADERSTLTAELYDPQSGNWAATGSMVTAISEPIALRLGDGRVLVMSHDGREAQVYDPASGAWRATGNLLQPRSSFTTSLLTDGRVLVIGGSASDAALASAELYDPLSGSWTDAAPMSTPRMSHTATVLADGRVLVVGGSTTTPGAAAAAATNAPSTAESGVLASAELYDPTSNTWTATGALHLARALHAAAPLPDGRVVVLGGTTFVEPTGEAYDQASGNWVIAPRAASWMTPSAIVFRDGRVLLVDSLGGLEFYDPDAPAPWHGPMSSLHGSGASATLLADGRVLFAGGVVLSSPGGYGLRSDHLASAHLLDPGAWSR